MAIAPQIQIIHMSVQFISTILAKSKDAIEIPRHIKEIVVLPMKANAIIAANGINKEPKMASQFLDELPIFMRSNVRVNIQQEREPNDAAL